MKLLVILALAAGDPTKDVYADNYEKSEILVFYRIKDHDKVVRACKRLGFKPSSRGVPVIDEGLPCMLFWSRELKRPAMWMGIEIKEECLVLSKKGKPDASKLEELAKHPSVREVGCVYHSRYMIWKRFAKPRQESNNE